MSGNLPVRYFTPETGAAMTCRTLNKLASHTGMSRAAFAKHFGQTVGITPIEYLTQWRMPLASNHLQNSDETISGVSAALGYESESAFRKAFKRVTGASPGKLTHSKKF
ncbi:MULTISPECIES: helix-turn-helix domain-containing protein [Pantoea]|nr:helix-turn-helix transcriptional regulator [Pantoea agglomerans]MDY0998166.1 helix-turn-helix transcriptional regulator [Pantoea agglomerans]NEG51900.1 helix-turn-helix domain-containing protein [Pantoea agglomerans]NQS81835.1 helix-turn-helix transcriptional regulator [Pantoea agglomerans]